MYRRKKKQMAVAAAQENEKTEMYNASAPPPPQVMAAAAPAASIRSTATAPRLSLRPVTQFDPTFNEQRKSGGNLLNVAAAGAAAGAVGAAASQSQNQNLSPSTSAERPTSAWERRGAANASAANPFSDPETPSGSAPANPFGNNAAVDTKQAAIPDSPPNASPMTSAMHSSKPSADFASPAPAIVAADVNPAAIATAVSTVPPQTSEAPTSELPAPPTVNANAGNVPASPAWTEDIPASPGPAPAGPLPVVGAAAGNRSQSPAPGPAPGPGPNNVHRVQLDFKPSMQDELDLHAGQLVRMLHEYDDGWVSIVFRFI
jgi:hypothetical protein